MTMEKKTIQSDTRGRSINRSGSRRRTQTLAQIQLK